VSLQKEAEKKFGVKPTIKTGKRGDMAILVNGKPVFAFHTEGTMPTTQELLKRIEAAQT